MRSEYCDIVTFDIVILGYWDIGILGYRAFVPILNDVIFYLMESLKLDDLEIYQLSLGIGESVWGLVDKWPYFAKRTVGEQFVRAADSVSSNLAEGYGRFFFKDRKLFCYYSRGSLLETMNWTNKSLNRTLISQIDYDLLIAKMDELHHKLNIYIKKLKSNSL